MYSSSASSPYYNVIPFKFALSDLHTIPEYPSLKLHVIFENKESTSWKESSVIRSNLVITPNVLSRCGSAYFMISSRFCI
jgi:hypothetical protein